MLVLGLALVVLVVIREPMLTLLERLVRFSYSDPNNLLGKALRVLSPNVQALPLEAYLRKAHILALRGWLVLLCAAAVGFAIAGGTTIPPALRRLAGRTAIAGLLLGLVTSIRILGPAVGALVALYAFSRPSRLHAVVVPVYAAIGIAVSYATWPYLWAAPVDNFLNVLQNMAAVPETLDVLYAGRILSSESLPIDYLPRLMLLTLTESTLFLATLGGLSLARHRLARAAPATALLPILLWFALPLGYVVATSLPIHDAYRHFLFILPPVFILAGLGLDRILAHARSSWMRWVIVCVSLAPGAIGIVLLHPYEYTHFNAISGGMAAASRNYETDYWLTCYREVMRSPALSDSRTVFVLRQPSLAALYAGPGISIQGYDPTRLPLRSRQMRRSS